MAPFMPSLAGREHELRAECQQQTRRSMLIVSGMVRISA